MTGATSIGRFAGLAALLTTVAIPSAATAATAGQADQGVSMAIASDDALAPTLTMMRRSDMEGEGFVAGPFEVIQLLLSDGTTLTLGAGTALSVDHYIYDTWSGQGALAMTLSRGVLKIVGGTLNNTTPIDVATPGGKVTLDNATAVIVVEEGGATTVALDYGNSVVLTTEDGEQARIVKPGFEVAVAADGDISGPYRRAPEDVVKIARALNPGLTTGIAPVADVETETEPAPEQVALVAPEEEAEEEEAAAGEEAAVQAEETAAQIEDDLTDTRAETGVFDDTGAGGVLVTALGFDAGNDVGILDTGATSPSQSTSDRRSLAQNRDPRLRPGQRPPNLEANEQSDALRPRGLTSNIIFNANEAASVNLGAKGEALPRRALVRGGSNDGGSDLQYVFYGELVGQVVSDKMVLVQEGDEVNVGGFLTNGSTNFSAVAL